MNKTNDFSSLRCPILAVNRHRIATDGVGVTTLVGFYGCPLRCKYCLNPACFSENSNCTMYSPRELYEKVKCDDLYFLATGGGVTFGGGEPLLYPDFLREFRSLCTDRWHICAETSLNVEQENVRIAAECVDCFYIDCKDTDSVIYRNYTGKSNEQMLENLVLLLKLVSPERITVRVPLIKDFNTEEDRIKSQKLLSDLGVTHFDLFEYIIK